MVGCMINMEDKSMIFTLNGEILITNNGSELCFTDFETEDGEPAIVTLGRVFSFHVYFTGANQRLSWGQTTDLKYQETFLI